MTEGPGHRSLVGRFGQHPEIIFSLLKIPRSEGYTAERWSENLSATRTADTIVMIQDKQGKLVLAVILETQLGRGDDVKRGSGEHPGEEPPVWLHLDDVLRGAALRRAEVRRSELSSTAHFTAGSAISHHGVREPTRKCGHPSPDHRSNARSPRSHTPPTGSGIRRRRGSHDREDRLDTSPWLRRDQNLR